MMFKVMAPFYDRFIRSANIDYSKEMPEWLDPVKDMEVLDLGGGTGMNAESLSGAGARVTVADTSQSMLNRAAAKNIPARLVLADAGALPLPDCSFDIVLVSDAWHHFRNQAGILGEIVRVLRPSGRLYLIDFDPGRKETKLIAFFERILGEPSSFMAPDELVEMLRVAGIMGSYRSLRLAQYIYRGVKQTPCR